MQIGVTQNEWIASKGGGGVYLIEGHRWSRDLLTVWFGAALPLVYDQVDGHLSFQAADVPMTEIITQLVYLQGVGGGWWRERERVADRHTHTHTLNRASHTYTLRQTGNFTGVISPPPSKVCVFLQFFQKCFHLALKSCARDQSVALRRSLLITFFFLLHSK